MYVGRFYFGPIFRGPKARLRPPSRIKSFRSVLDEEERGRRMEWNNAEQERKITDLTLLLRNAEGTLETDWSGSA